MSPVGQDRSKFCAMRIKNEVAEVIVHTILVLLIYIAYIPDTIYSICREQYLTYIKSSVPNKPIVKQSSDVKFEGMNDLINLTESYLFL